MTRKEFGRLARLRALLGPPQDQDLRATVREVAREEITAARGEDWEPLLGEMYSKTRLLRRARLQSEASSESPKSGSLAQPAE
jgi:hypothetical protein